MIKNKNVWLLGLLVALVFGASVYAQDRDDYRGRWTYLGNAHVDGGQDHVRHARRVGDQRQQRHVLVVLVVRLEVAYDPWVPG